MSWEIRQGDALERLREMPDESVHCCVTSPPYWGLRDYGVAGQLGLERTPELYIERMVAVFREVKRVLRADGTLWVNMGDSYAGSWGNYHPNSPPGKHGQRVKESARWNRPAYSSQEFLPPTAGVKRVRVGNHIDPKRARAGGQAPNHHNFCESIKAKDLVGIPWLLAFALRADGWWLRQDIIWSKPNPMPESVTDRCTKAHEYLFLLAKSQSYFYDAEAVKERSVDPDGSAARYEYEFMPEGCKYSIAVEGTREFSGFRNRRSVWEITTQPFGEAHFATFPPKLIEPCILAGCPQDGTVLDPFSGAGTTGLVATRLGRNYLGIELNESYCEMSRRRIVDDAPLLNSPRSVVPEGIGTLPETHHEQQG